jgi:uncharacterized protein
MKSKDDVFINSVRQWFEKAVLGLNLCPFAFRPYKQGTIHFELSNARDDEGCLNDVYDWLLKMENDESIETMILIIPHHLAHFDDYNQFMALAELLLEQQGWEGTFQIASFHPDYCFDGAQYNDRANWTNRSPFPLLHLIREQSISSVIDSNADVDQVPHTNIKKLNSMDDAAMQEIFGRRFVDAETSQANPAGKKIPE